MNSHRYIDGLQKTTPDSESIDSQGQHLQRCDRSSSPRKIPKKNYLDVLLETDEKRNDYQRSYEQFIECMKLGVHLNFVDGVEIAELLKGNSSKSEDELISLKEYIDCTKEGQNETEFEGFL